MDGFDDCQSNYVSNDYAVVSNANANFNFDLDYDGKDCTMKIINRVIGGSSPYDGEYFFLRREYDPLKH